MKPLEIAFDHRQSLLPVRISAMLTGSRSPARNSTLSKRPNALSMGHRAGSMCCCGAYNPGETVRSETWHEPAREKAGPANIGMFPILETSPGRLILGMNDRHLDFRLQVDVEEAGNGFRT